MRAFGKYAFACAALLSIAAMPAQATTILSTFDAGNVYNCCSGWTVSGSTSSNPQYTAANEFVSPGDYSLEQIDLGLASLSGTNGAVVSLWTESAGAPGIQLGSWSVGGFPSFGSSSNAVTTISGISGINLASGVAYFLVIAPGADDTWVVWNQNSIGANGLDLFSQDSGATWDNSNGITTLGAFDLIGTTSDTVPEPITLALFGAGLAGVSTLRRRRK